MQITTTPNKEKWQSLFARPNADNTLIHHRVHEIIEAVIKEKDKALFELTQTIDKVALNTLEVSDAEFEDAFTKVSQELKDALHIAKMNIEKFHTAQLSSTIAVETMQGVYCRQEYRAIKRVGIYVPGGSAPLVSTVLMLAIPATIAGCKEIVMCTPPHIAPVILYAAKLCGVSKIYKVGGGMAIAAMAYGTESIAPVNKIFGPGNAYVTTAKQLVAHDVAIDMPAGPSEVMIVADDTAHADYVAADMLAQLEHGADSQALAITFSQNMANSIVQSFHEQLPKLSRKAIATAAAKNSMVIVAQSRDIALEMVNFYAPEHLILSINNAEDFAQKVESAGSIFLGNYSPESAGDYASGTNHTLPTHGWASAISGISTESFIKKITIQNITPQGLLNLANTVETIANAEGLTAHTNSIAIRRKNILKNV